MAKMNATFTHLSRARGISNNIFKILILNSNLNKSSLSLKYGSSCRSPLDAAFDLGSALSMRVQLSLEEGSEA